MKRSKSLKQIAKLGKSRFFVLMSMIAIIGSFTSEGTMEISAQFFQLVSGFTIADQASLLTVVGVAGLLIQFVLLPLLMSRVQKQEKYLVVATNVTSCMIN